MDTAALLPIQHTVCSLESYSGNVAAPVGPTHFKRHHQETSNNYDQKPISQVIPGSFKLLVNVNHFINKYQNPQRNCLKINIICK